LIFGPSGCRNTLARSDEERYNFMRATTTAPSI